MKINYHNNKIEIRDVEISLERTLFCGQAFRFFRKGNGEFCGVVKDKYIELRQQENGFDLINANEPDLEFWKSYFDLDRDYQKINDGFSTDEFLQKGMEYARGIRILKQDIFETLISFIISANNNVGRITGIINRLCERYGEQIRPQIFAFPKAERLADLTQQDFLSIGAGYRSAYLYKTCQMIKENNNLEDLENLPYEQAVAQLQKYMGVGRKVADCIALFSLGKMQAFPLDVWMKRVIFDIYKLDKKSDVFEFIKNKFGENAGIAQQYLFYYARENKLTKP